MVLFFFEEQQMGILVPLHISNRCIWPLQCTSCSLPFPLFGCLSSSFSLCGLFYFGNLRGLPLNATFPPTNSRPYFTGFLTTIIIMHFNMELAGARGVAIVLVDVDVVVFFEEPGMVLATVKALRSGSSSSSNMASMPRTILFW